jgi:hypothetical protein
MTKRILTGAAIVAVSAVIGGIAVFAQTPADIDRAQRAASPTSAGRSCRAWKRSE